MVNKEVFSCQLSIHLLKLKTERYFLNIQHLKNERN
jgi:hypothetical protein